MAFEYVKIGDGVTAFSNLPYVAGMPGATGPQGATGSQGASGVSGGLTLQLEYTTTSTFAGTPLSGTLLTSYDTGTQTSITVPANTSSTQIATFIIGTGSLPGTVAVASLWDLNLYAFVSVPTSPALFYFAVYDGSTPVQSGTLASATSVNLGTPAQLFTYTLYVPAWTYTNNLTINLYAQTASGSTLTIDFRGLTLSHLHTSLVCLLYTSDAADE